MEPCPGKRGGGLATGRGARKASSQEARAVDTNLTAHYLATQTARTRLPAQAERGWLADQAAVARPRRSMFTSARRWAGMALIRTGESVQGTARPVFDAIAADRFPASIHNA